MTTLYLMGFMFLDLSLPRIGKSVLVTSTF